MYVIVPQERTIKGETVLQDIVRVTKAPNIDKKTGKIRIDEDGKPMFNRIGGPGILRIATQEEDHPNWSPIWFTKSLKYNSYNVQYEMNLGKTVWKRGVLETEWQVKTTKHWTVGVPRITLERYLKDGRRFADIKDKIFELFDRETAAIEAAEKHVREKTVCDLKSLIENGDIDVRELERILAKVA